MRFLGVVPTVLTMRISGYLVLLYRWQFAVHGWFSAHGIIRVIGIVGSGAAIAVHGACIWYSGRHDVICCGQVTRERVWIGRLLDG